jgi:hypothetical protein
VGKTQTDERKGAARERGRNNSTHKIPFYVARPWALP